LPLQHNLKLVEEPLHNNSFALKERCMLAFTSAKVLDLLLNVIGTAQLLDIWQHDMHAVSLLSIKTTTCTVELAIL
jgi:hypothetical protein